LEKKTEEIGKKIQECETMLFNEAEEDGKYRNMYMNRWNRKASSQLNVPLFQTLYEYKQKLAQAKSCDQLVKEGVMNNMKYFELINLTREQLKNKLPVKTDTNILKDGEEAKSLSQELEVLDGYKAKLVESVNKIFQTLNDDNVITQMIKVLQKKTTEQAIIAEGKAKYEAMVKTTEEIHTLIVESKKKVTALNERFVKKKLESMKTTHENEKFFADLESYVQLYNQKSGSIGQGLSFYGEFAYRINDVYQKATDLVMARDIEKNELIRTLNGQSNNNYNQNSNQFNYGAQNNVITNMDYQYTYSYTAPNQYNYGNNQNKSGTTYNLNPSQGGYNQNNYNFK